MLVEALNSRGLTHNLILLFLFFKKKKNVLSFLLPSSPHVWEMRTPHLVMTHCNSKKEKTKPARTPFNRETLFWMIFNIRFQLKYWTWGLVAAIEWNCLPSINAKLKDICTSKVCPKYHFEGGSPFPNSDQDQSSNQHPEFSNPLTWYSCMSPLRPSFDAHTHII